MLGGATAIETGEKRREAASKVPLDLVFGCLGSDDEETLLFATQLLEDILQYVPFETLVKDYAVRLPSFHPSPFSPGLAESASPFFCWS